MFISTKEGGISISCGSVDGWRQLSSSENYGYSRTEFNMEHLLSTYSLTKTDIAEEYGVSLNKVDFATYNGK